MTAVLRVSEYCSNVNPSAIIVYRRNQANLVASNIEHGQFTNLVRRRKRFSQIREIGEISVSDQTVPTRESRFRVQTERDKFVKALATYYVHDREVSRDLPRAPIVLPKVYLDKVCLLLKL